MENVPCVIAFGYHILNMFLKTNLASKKQEFIFRWDTVMRLKNYVYHWEHLEHVHFLYVLTGEKCLLEKVDEKTNQGQGGML